PSSEQPPSATCLKPHEVPLFLQGHLPPERRQRVEAHLGGCARCRAQLAQSAASPAHGSHPSAPRDFEPGSRVDRYVIERVLGMGGMGAVYLAHDPELHRRVAIKLLHTWLSELPEHEEHKSRFLREAQAMASVSHPNVVTIHDLLHVEGQLFVAMEYVEGTTLREWVRTPRSTRQILEIFRQAGAGLAAAHAAGLIHRDIKPSNILIGVDGSVRVSDFGLARSREGVPEAPRPERAPGQERWLGQELTLAGRVVGTPGYMAPEQMTLLAPVDERSDQFSFCAALYETLHGCRPFAGSTEAVLERNMRARRFQPSRTRARVPPWLSDVVLRGLSYEPKERFPSMEALLQALARDPAREQESARSRVRRRVRRGVLLGALATGLVMALAPTSAWRGFEERAQGLLLTARPRPWNQQVVLLAIDQPTIDAVGWPQPRHVQARMVEALGRAGVKAIGIDSFLYLPARDGPGADAALGEAIARYGRVVLAAPCTFEANDKARALARRLESSSLAPGPSPRFGCQGVLAPQEPLLR
ncbi:MAG TPA: protein kinase, partial [Cystobacter sp.]